MNNTKIYNLDLRHIKKRNKIFNKLKIIKKKKIILFFNEPFEIYLINKIAYYFINKYKKIYLILVNTSDIKLVNKKKLVLKKRKIFTNKSKNMFIFETK